MTAPMSLRYSDDLLVRFRDKYQVVPNGCWLWTATKDKDGYGGIQFRREKVRAHRLSWQMFRGPIPAGAIVCHKCDTPSCVNPDHLFVGTFADNMRDKIRKGRDASRERHGRAKLTEAAVAEIRANREVPASEFSERLGVSKSLVYQVRAGDIWREAA